MNRPPLPTGTPIERLKALMARLRDKETGCPWDIEQSFETIAPHTLEEAYEVAEAIAQKDMAALKDELGDLLLQVIFYAQMAREADLFDFDAVADAICDKLIRRHPHVFGDMVVESAEAQTAVWEQLKAEERARKGSEAKPPSALDGVAIALPALTRAVKLQKRAARVGFDWPDDEGGIQAIFAKIEEEIGELKAERASGDRAALELEMGDILFVLANLARKLGIDPEAALRATNAKFDRRFRRVEAIVAERGKSFADCNLLELDQAWDRVKAEEKA